MTQPEAITAINELDRMFKEYVETSESYISALQRHIINLQTKLDAK